MLGCLLLISSATDEFSSGMTSCPSSFKTKFFELSSLLDTSHRHFKDVLSLVDKSCPSLISEEWSAELAVNSARLSPGTYKMSTVYQLILIVYDELQTITHLQCLINITK